MKVPEYLEVSHTYYDHCGYDTISKSKIYPDEDSNTISGFRDMIREEVSEFREDHNRISLTFRDPEGKVYFHIDDEDNISGYDSDKLFPNW